MVCIRGFGGRVIKKYRLFELKQASISLTTQNTLSFAQKIPCRFHRDEAEN